MTTDDLHDEELDLETKSEGMGELSISGNHTHTSSSKEEEEAKERERDMRNRIIKREQKHVRCARFAVIFAIVTCCVAVTVSVFIFAKKGDERSFELEYERVVLQIKDMVHWQIQYNFALMQMLSADITTAATLVNASFPYFTHPQIEVPAGYTDGMGGIMMAAYVPLIDGDQQEEWEKYAFDHQDWIVESAKLKKTHAIHRDPLKGTFQSYEGDRRRRLHVRHRETSSISRSLDKTGHGQYGEQDKRGGVISPRMWLQGEGFTKIPIRGTEGQTMAPLWQSSPANADAVNVDLFSDPRFKNLFDTVLSVRHAVMSPATEIGDLFDWMFDDNEKDRKAQPHAFLMDLVYPDFGKDIEDVDYQKEDEPVGFVLGLTSYKNYFDRSLPEGTDGILCVLEEACGDPFTYEIFGKKATFVGVGDHHDSTYDDYRKSTPLELYTDTGACPHTLHIYPTKAFQESYETNQRWMFAGVVILAFGVTALILLAYDFTVTRRQNKTMEAVLRTNNFVASLFPKGIHDRLMEDAMKRDSNNGDEKKAFLAKQHKGSDFGTLPIADFFPDTTIMFSDIAGFTAWSSSREPVQVFTLLEALYGAFDKLAARRRVFKVETVGDSYVASAGVPNARQDHAAAMCRFATDCLKESQEIFRSLEVNLGPDTSDLSFRTGLHSGPVTGGVLRGQNARFQLFGDTMNTAARMEQTGIRGRIQLSEATAEILRAKGKGHWLRVREGGVTAKGKGCMKSYWLDIHSNGSTASSSMAEAENSQSSLRVEEEKAVKKAPSRISNVDPKTDRLIDWNAQVLSRLLRQVVAHRRSVTAANSSSNRIVNSNSGSAVDAFIPTMSPLEEVKEIIQLPGFLPNLDSQNLEEIELGERVTEQLRAYITLIAEAYRDNPFHNFEHASHVTMSTVKLLSRIVAPKKNVDPSVSLHDHTYGITSDPLTQFSVIISALMHDADHQGVPNGQLIKEEQPIATTYQGRSVAEQHSVDLGWDHLMEPQFTDLRNVIYTSASEKQRFRQLVVNSVMATDIMDKELKKDRNDRWDRAFGETDELEENPQDTVNRKATIVIEHLLQASDVSHTMQHWHIYRKWNENLFAEMYKAYKEGRAEKDPSEFWYKGEIGFFDFYIIPLAKKLKECGVFGVSSDEYLSYAERNRSEWEVRGQGVVAEMVATHALGLDASVVE